MPAKTEAWKDLRIAVIGAGMGGLGCALALAKKGFKHVDVYETASNLGFVGAGIQMAPNLVRILQRLGCWEGIEKEATDVKASSIRDGATNKELTYVAFPNIRELYGAPHCTGHRTSLAGGLYDACKAEPAITFHFASALTKIVSYEPKAVFEVTPRGGSPYTVEADVLLGCDGIKSPTRQALLREEGFQADVEGTGQAAYRIMLDRSQMCDDPELLELLESDVVVRWIGERRHLIAYAVSSHTVYNISTTQPDVNFAAATNAAYTTRGSKAKMLEVFDDFCPVVHKLLSLVPEGEVCEWKLQVHRALPTWVRGRVALAGDACHPTLPHLSQGAAMAVEDGAVLAEVLARSGDEAPADTATLNRCLKAYELLRKERCATLVDLAAFSGRNLHLGEGAAREERDRLFKAAREAAREQGKAAPAPVPDKWASPEVQQMIYSYDCVKEAEDKFDFLFEQLRKDEESDKGKSGLLGAADK